MARILIVDDEPLIAIMVAEWVEELGHDAIGPAHDVASALTLLDANPVDAAIVDVSLGADSGYTLADVLDKRAIRYLLATGHAASALDANYVTVPTLMKPYAIDTLKSSLDELLA
jgi:CheY-like chemotaxis protein